MSPFGVTFSDKRRTLQLETLYDLALHLSGPESVLVEEVLERVAAVLDPSAALVFAVGRTPVAGSEDEDEVGGAVAQVGWQPPFPVHQEVLESGVWNRVVEETRTLQLAEGTFLGRRYEHLLAVPVVGGSACVGLLVVLDKEDRAGGVAAFQLEDRRFLESAAVLMATAIANERRLQSLAQRNQALEEENRALRAAWSEVDVGTKVVARARPLQEAMEVLGRVAPRGISVLIRGESGTGKELMAKVVHGLSGRPGPLVAINCAALPETLLESELFGIERGVATGVRARRGQFELADRGTLFLDEIGDLEPALQVKLLRALQEGEITRVGGSAPIPVDVRVVSATHQDLEAKLTQGAFREDLYYRLKGVEVRVPPLRERHEDIAPLIRHFTREFSRREGIEPPTFTAEALALLVAHDYPGNVRELKNLVEAALSLAGEGDVGSELVRSLLGSAPDAMGPTPLDLGTVERRHIQRVLQLANGNKSRAARMLGIDRRTLQRRGF